MHNYYRHSRRESAAIAAIALLANAGAYLRPDGSFHRRGIRVIKIWGRNSSTNVQKVMWTIGELGLPHTRNDIGGPFGGTRESKFLALNPNGLIPTMVDDDFVLWESNAIIRYLSRKYGHDRLEPADTRTWSIANQWCDWQVSTVLPAINDAIVGLQRTKRNLRDHSKISASQLQTTNAMKILDQRLSQTRFTASDDFSFADIPLGVMAFRYRHLVPDRPTLVNLERWFAELQGRPAFREHVEDAPMTWLKPDEL